MSDTCSWPEQDAVCAWMRERGIELPHKEVLPLIEAVTKLRVEKQRLADHYEDAFDRRGVAISNLQQKNAELERMAGELADGLRSSIDLLEGTWRMKRERELLARYEAMKKGGV